MARWFTLYICIFHIHIWIPPLVISIIEYKKTAEPSKLVMVIKVGYLPIMSVNARNKAGSNRDKQGQAGTPRDKAGTNRDKQGLSVPFFPSLSLSVNACACMSLSVPLCPCLSLSVPLCPYPSLSVPVCQCPTMSDPVFPNCHHLYLLVRFLSLALSCIIVK